MHRTFRDIEDTIQLDEQLLSEKDNTGCVTAEQLGEKGKIQGEFSFSPWIFLIQKGF